MLAAREEIIERILRSADAHTLDYGELVAACVHATAQALIDVAGVSRRQAGEALEVSVRRYLAEMA